MPVDARDASSVEAAFADALSRHGEGRVAEIWEAFKDFAAQPSIGTRTAAEDLLCFEADTALLKDQPLERLTVSLRRQFSFGGEAGEYEGMAELSMYAVVAADPGWSALEYTDRWGTASPEEETPLAPDATHPERIVESPGAVAWAAAVERVDAFAVALPCEPLEFVWGYEEM